MRCKPFVNIYLGKPDDSIYVMTLELNVSVNRVALSMMSDKEAKSSKKNNKRFINKRRTSIELTKCQINCMSTKLLFTSHGKEPQIETIVTVSLLLPLSFLNQYSNIVWSLHHNLNFPRTADLD